jgi:hypothetical protein
VKTLRKLSFHNGDYEELIYCWLLVFFFSSTLKKEATCSSETSVDFQRTTLSSKQNSKRNKGGLFVYFNKCDIVRGPLRRHLLPKLTPKFTFSFHSNWKLFALSRSCEKKISKVG